MKNERKPPLRLLQEEALARRLPKNHPILPKVHNSIEKRRAGYRGELNMDYHLTFLPHNRYTIVRDLHLTDQFPFQIDTLLLSPQVIFILETKNIFGELFFDKYSKQLIRTVEGNENGFTNPREQAQRQSYQFQNWLIKHNFPSIPIEHFATISYPQSIMKTNDEKLFDRVFHTEHIVNKILEFEQPYSTSVADSKMIRKIHKTLIKENTPMKINILNKWGISPHEIIKDIQCPTCLRYPMKRNHGIWFCPYCMNESKEGHIQAIKDYFLLFDSPITNKTCREFLLLSSRRTSQQILNSMNLIKKGTTKSVFYIEND
ncbi:nuclease-related domain-containing protein [Niallia sp. XMNu-256]|uniref:nuclease-related domain-containing protein n=1 Tax=Niallia sp. XMNu-256 TaxID=3082444 RepID=UPI0030CEE806